MKQHYFQIDLKQPVIISQQAATVGAHQSLDYISGSSLLGLCASQLYSLLSADEAFTLFHSGKVRFLNALPVSHGQMAYPVPLSLHHFKGETYTSQDRLLQKQVFDVSQVSHQDLNNRQPVQLRGFYLTLSGHKINPVKEQTLKTAIDKNHNRAAEGQLFGYEALSAGQQLQFAIHADDDVDDALLGRVIDAVQGTAYLGRSRSSQFGKVQIDAITPIKASHPQPDPILTLWLVSDLCLQMEGQPTLLPLPEHLGLPKGSEWLSDRSFVRTRRYSIFNTYRRHYDKERQVITQGSVVRYRLPQATDFTALCQTLGQGIGLYTEQGLGQFMVNPHILGGARPVWDKVIELQSNRVAVEVGKPGSLLIQTLQRRADRFSLGAKPKEIAAGLFAQLCQMIVNARRYHGVRRSYGFESVNQSAPTRTQFGGLKELANSLRNNKSTLWHELSNDVNGFLYIKVVQEDHHRQSGKSYKNSGWDLTFDSKPDSNLGTALLNQLQTYKDQDYFPQIVGELAVLGMSDEWQKYSIGLNQEIGAQT